MLRVRVSRNASKARVCSMNACHEATLPWRLHFDLRLKRHRLIVHVPALALALALALELVPALAGTKRCVILLQAWRQAPVDWPNQLTKKFQRLLPMLTASCLRSGPANNRTRMAALARKRFDLNVEARHS